MPPSFWHHALEMATYLLNILPTKVTSPPLKFFIKGLLIILIPECLVVCVIPFSLHLKSTNSKSTPCVFLGYPANHRGYKCYDVSSRQILIARHV